MALFAKTARCGACGSTEITCSADGTTCRCRACGTGRNEKAVRSPEPDRFPFRAARRYMRPLSSEAPASTDFFRKALPDLKLQVIPI